MTLDIRGSLKSTRISSNKYIVIEELISNSIESFLIRRHFDSAPIDLDISLYVEMFPIDILKHEFDLSITCTDNGCGFGDDQTKAFLTKDTSYKDDLPIPGIGKCKGSGRVQFFHHFNQIDITSTYVIGNSAMTRALQVHDGRSTLEQGDFRTTEGGLGPVGATIKLASLKDMVRNRVYAGDSLTEIFLPDAIRRHILMTFIQRLVSLKSELGDFKIAFSTRIDNHTIAPKVLRASDLPSVSTVRETHVEELNPNSGEPLHRSLLVRLSHFKLDPKQYELRSNAVSLCAKSTPVKDITARFLRTRTEQNNASNGYFHIVLVESDLFDRRVNEQRDEFVGIPDEIPTGDLFVDETVSYAALYNAIDPIIDSFVTPPDWRRDAVIRDVAKRFGVSASMLAETNTRVVYGDTPRSITERVLKKYQDQIILDTEVIFNLKDEIVKAEPHSISFRQKIDELSWRYTSSLKSFDMANLSQLVVRRAAIVEVLALACKKQLCIQGETVGRRQDESIIHSIFFPMKKDSGEVSDHDIWLLSEEYQYYDYIASDKSLSKIAWSESENLFEEDIDDELAEILKRRADSNSCGRPDIAIFSKEGSVIIVEFKAPGVSMDEHIGDLSEYAHLLAAKSKGRLKKFYGYLIGDCINRLRMSGYTRFPVGKGFFRSTPLHDPESGRSLGELYEEIMFFEDVVARARKRIDIYKDRLNIGF